MKPITTLYLFVHPMPYREKTRQEFVARIAREFVLVLFVLTVTGQLSNAHRLCDSPTVLPG